MADLSSGWFPKWHTLTPRLPVREFVRRLEPEFSLLRYWTEKPEEWREGLRAKLVDILGLPGERCELDVRELYTVPADGYARTKIAYNVEDGLTCVAWVCVPEDYAEPLPAVVCAHPRGPGKDQLVGLTSGPEGGACPPIANELAAQGYVTLAPDARCFGERMDDEAGMACTGALLGRPLAGMQAWDLIRSVDYLEQRPDVRSDRIGITGVGMGALHGLFAAAVDERVACTAVTGGLSTYRELIVARDCFSGSTPPLDALPQLLRYADLDDVACLIAPRPLMMAQDQQDPSVPPRGAEECLERTRAGYVALGEKIKFEGKLTDAGAGFDGDSIYQFHEDWLKLPGPGPKQKHD